MRLLVQRVKEAAVKVEGTTIGSIGQGLLVFLGIHRQDTEEQGTYLVKKLLALRIFHDEERKMNRSIQEVDGNILVVSQFTLYGNCLNGRRPDFIDAAPPERAQALYQNFILQLEKEWGKKVEQGSFGAYMEVSITNDGPVTFFIER